ncbi:BglG family transcription antiterminator [Enterococcus raffinosus]|uniref:PTS sugar transporter subunit IIA n=1 Tax=Enterococcus raffinosus TaxID=71452 RepID=A0AAW8T9F5_9ENTE|nr:PTS sugar transporter subunit IIA [Enterococcus raffinosus]MDT2524321.1 PTS sugar transporter subunit IIA [Enterococcus raffinosus]MDT2530544.1 PTS sugar transporter subunit IIA [Enterococcus raffinosus]MDT2535254.1 PTS sugar transporter subunit IIA [Enterococcus raffinosus]MDT2545194.1 PTS sugar transporter subunit IIA [Enterococcus raffinosus]MDT2578719.1 PTS sugar transporter subunit IIA [Enterococcus raffinosus]
MKDRTAKILRIFITSDYPVTLEQLEEEFHTSSRTIRNELREINLLLRTNQLPEVKNLRKKGYHLLLDKDQKQRLLDQMDSSEEEHYLDRESRIFDLILSFSLGKNATFLYQKEEAYQISKSSLDEDMRRVRNILKEYGIEVLSVPKQGIVLQGAERSIRTMIYDVINTFVGVISPQGEQEASVNLTILHHYISPQLLKKLEQLYVDSVDKMEDAIYRNQLLVFTAVWLSRYMREDLIASSAWEAADTPQSDIRDFVTAICDAFQLSPPEVEIKYIVFMLNTFNSRDMNNSIEWVQAQLLSIQLMQFVEEKTKIPFSRKEEMLQEGLYKHLVGLINRVKSDIQIVNPLKENVKKNYGNIYSAIRHFTPSIEQVTGKQITEDEIAFLTIHFSTSVSAINQDLHYIYKAVVICNHGVATGKLLSENLKELFNIEVLAVLSSRELDLIEKLDVDLIFSTVAIHYSKKPVLELEPIIKEESKKRITSFLNTNQKLKRLVNHQDSTQLFYALIETIEKSGGEVSGNIYKELETLFDQNHLTINKKEIQPMLEDVLKDSNILLNEQVTTWEDSIRRVSEPLIKEKIIEPRYVTAMIDSVKEYGPYIVIGKYIALAHARPEDGVNSLGISVATIKEPIAFGNEENDPVKIIFCLAAVDSYSHLNIMKSLIELINDEEKIDRLSGETDIERFKEILFS